jgi:F-type H+-transporting ATPase subunit a
VDIASVIKLALAAVAGAAAFVFRNMAKQKASAEGAPAKYKKNAKLLTMVMVVCIWYFIGAIVSAFSGPGGGLSLEFQMASSRTVLFGYSFSDSAIITWAIILIVLALSQVFRFILFPKFKDIPGGFQNVMETAVEGMEKFTKGVTGHLSGELPVYMFSIALLLVGCAVSELFGQRPPTSDLVMTFSLGLATFFLINLLSIMHKGLGGRIKSLTSPSPIMLPMKILSDIAVPISLACRLFGNMLGGMIVMDLLKSSLGGFSVGVTAVAGIYFNVFHPLIQTYIFIILSLTFINEAAE